MEKTEAGQLQGVMDEIGAQPGEDTRLRWGEVYVGDCLAVAGKLGELGGVDLIYADPPFFTNKEQLGGGEEGHAFEDRWREGRGAYLEWLGERVKVMRAGLKETGVFLLHLDWHAVHYAKVMCDGIFGEDCFQNELIWYYQTGGASKGRFSRKHDTILVYSRGEKFYFDGKGVAIPRTPKAMKRAQCATGARIKATDTHKNPDDVITIAALNPMANERCGYPTQKPVALLEMLITALCPGGGSVGDFFCGSGTTLVAAGRGGRKWVGGDVSEGAVGVARGRVRDLKEK